MAQIDVYNWLKEKSELGTNWYTVPEIIEGLRSKGLGNGSLKGIYEHLYRLVLSNQLEFRGVGIWRHYKIFRYKRVNKE